MCLALAALSANVQAANIFWNAATAGSDFSLAANWNPAVFPTPGNATTDDINRMENGVAASVLTSPFSTNELWIGSTTAENAALNIFGVGILNQSDFTLTATSWVEIGEGFTDTTRDNVPGGTGTLNLSGNAVFIHNTTGNIQVGEAATGAATTGTVNLSGNAILDNSSGARFIVGNGSSGTGYLNINGNATLNLSSDFSYLGFSGGTGIATMNGGTINSTSGGYFVVGGYTGGKGTFNFNGGTINCTSFPLTIGDGAGAVGNFYLNGGLLYTPGIWAGVGWDAGNATGNFYFNGGELRASSASASANFMAAAPGQNGVTNPGTLYVYIQPGGAKINTNGYNVTVPSTTSISDDPLSAPGGSFNKLGAGTLTFNQSSLNFTGNITVSAGTLQINFSGWSMQSPITTVASGATLGGSVSFQKVVVQPPVAGVRAGLAPGDGLNNNSMPMANLDMTSAQLTYLIRTPSNSGLIDVSAGTLNVSTSVYNSATLKNEINLTQNLATASETTAGVYPLMKYSAINYVTGGNFAANFELLNPYLGDWDAFIGQGPDAVDPNAEIYLQLKPSANEWIGANGANYSIQSNWKTTVPNGSGAKAMFAGAGTPPTVNLDINAQVGKIVFDNATSYTISSSNASRFILNAGTGVPAEIDDNGGSHTIAVGILMAKDTTFFVSGASDTLTMSAAITGANNTITKSGLGTLLLSADNGFGSTSGGVIVQGGTLQLDGNNSYNGATTVSNGTVIAKSIAYAGVASSIGAPATTSASNLVLDTSTLKYTGAAAASTNRGITLANAVTIDTAQNLAINGPVVMGTLAGPNVTLNTPGAGTITFGGQITSTGAVNKAGTGTLIYAAGSGVVSTISNASGPAYYIQNGNVIISGADNSTQYNAVAGEISVGTTAANGGNYPVSLTINGGTVNVGTWQSIGRGNTTTSTLTMNGGVLNAVSTSMGYIGDTTLTDWTGTQILNMNNNSVYNNTGTPFYVGESGGSNATVNMSGTAQLTTTTGPMWVANSVGSMGTLNINGSAQISVATFLSIGLNGTGFATIQGTASKLSSGNDLNVGDTAGAAGTLEVDGGTVQTTNLWVARNGTAGTPNVLSTGTVNQFGGAVVATNLTTGGGTAVYNLNGGTLTANIIRKNPLSTTGTGTLNFNGGVLKAGAADNPTGSSYFLSGLTAANVKAGGAKIDTNGFNVTVNQILAADTGSLGGGLTKQGGLGTLTVSQQSTYTGNTTVSAGILDMLNVNTPTATVLVGGGAELTATSIVSNTLTIAAGGTVVIKAIPGGPLSSSSLTPVPEPGTLVLLAMAAMAAAFAAWRRKKD
jgi:autotransporter-associated beta strand protein